MNKKTSSNGRSVIGRIIEHLTNYNGTNGAVRYDKSWDEAPWDQEPYLEIWASDEWSECS